MAQARRGGGFTLIELMVAVAIVALLAAIGVPAYQDYIRVVRTTESLGLVRGLMTQVEENVLNGLPADANLRYPVLSASSWVSSISVRSGSGAIVIAFKAKPFKGQSGLYLEMVPKQKVNNTWLNIDGSGAIPNGNIVWGCRSAEVIGGWTPTTMPAKWAPKICVGDPYR